jgi:hypothetical protein
MIFLNSIWFWGAMGVVGIAVPILIHLFSRHHSKPIEWAAMELLRKAMAVRARRVRMEDWILMVLRALAIGLIALAFARPSLTHLVPSRAKETVGTGVVIAIDGSFSMGHKPGVNSRFDSARQRVRSILDEMSPGDQVSLVLMGARPRVILRNVIYEPGRLDGELDQLAPLAESLDLAVCLDEVREIMKEIDLPSRECYIVTDAQATTWKSIPDTALAALQEMRKSGLVSLLPIESASAENVAVTQLTASGIPREGSLVRYVADVRNTGPEAARDVTVRLMVDGLPVDKKVLESIAPGEILPVSLFARFSKEGVYIIAAELGDDSLEVDNHRYLLADVRNGISVLCVDGDPSSEPFRSETDFLKAALQPGLMEQAGSGGIRVTRIPYGGLGRDTLQKHDIVILANLPDLPREDAAALGDFVKAGGGLMVFLGDNTTHGKSHSSTRSADGKPLLPGQLLELVEPGGNDGATATAWNIQTGMEDHQVTRALATLPKEQWGTILFKRYIKSAPHEGARVLMRLTPGDDPLLLSQQIGRGQVLLFTSSADRDWNDMVVHPTYLMMVQQSVMSLSRKFHEVPSMVSQPLVFELPSADKSTSVKIIDPTGKESKVQVSGYEGRRAGLVSSADRPGIYEMKSENGQFSLKLAVNVDSTESVVAVLEKQSLDEIANRLSLSVVDGENAVSGAVRTNRVGREIWRTLIITALGLLVLESLLSMWLVRRVTDTPDDEHKTNRGTI